MIAKLNNSLNPISPKDITTSIILVLLSLLVLPFSIFGIFIIVLLLLVSKYGEKAILLIALVCMIAATGPALEKFRFTFSFLSILYVFYFFIKEKGLDIKKYRKPPIELIILILFIVSAILITSFISGLQSQSILALLRTVIFFIICYSLFSLLEKKELLKIYFSSLILASLIISITVYYDMINAGLTLYVVQGVLARYAGIYGNPNYVGLLLSITTLFLFVSLFSNKLNSVSKKIAVWIILASNILAILITNSRSAIIGTIISLCFILYHLNKKLLQKILVSLVFITIILINLPFVQDFFNAFIRLETVSERSISWEIGWDIMMDNFLFGIGPENYESKVFTYVPSSTWQYFEVDTSIFKVHPHNYFLLMITENGILGLILSLLIFYVLFRLSWRVMKITKNYKHEEYLISLSIYSIGIVLFIRAFFEVDGIFSYGFITRDLPFWICFVVLAHLNVMQNHDIQIINRSKNLE